jgi:hypothetical protein
VDQMSLQLVLTVMLLCIREVKGTFFMTISCFGGGFNSLSQTVFLTPYGQISG